MKKNVYLYKSGVLSRQDSSLILKDKKGNVDYIPIEQIDTIICFGEITLNKRVLSLLNTYRIVILFFNFYGNYIGRYAPKNYIDGKILINQVKSYENITERQRIASTIIKSSLSNCLSVLKYYKKKGFILDVQIIFLTEAIKKINETLSIDELMLIEAKGRKQYYDCFDIILEKEIFCFNKRSKHPPENEINAMLSYGYSLLYANYLSVLDRSRIYSQISFVHSLTKCNESLHYDLADIMKPVIVDRLVLSLCRHKQVKREYLDYKDNRCYLNSQGAKFFVSEYDDYLKRTIKINQKYYSYKNIISREVHLLSNYLSKESANYKPYIMKW